MCGGIALTAWWVVSTGDGDRVAGAGPVPRPAVGTSTPPVPSSRSHPAVPSVPATPVAAPSTPTAVIPPPSGQATVPADGSLVPFGDSHAVVWPDQLRAVVSRADRFGLPDDLAARYPGGVEVYLWIEIGNYSPNDVTISQAQVKLWYGPDHTPAVQFQDPSDRYNGVTGTIKSDGSRLWGDATFVVPPQYLTQLVVELRPRPGDAPARFFGAAK
jgi:hypothetical protein